MDNNYDRGRSTSAGRATNMPHSRSPSAHHSGFNEHANALGLDPALTTAQHSFNNNTSFAQQDQQFLSQQSLGHSGLMQDTTTSHAYQNNVDTSAFLDPNTFAQPFGVVNPNTLDFNTDFDASTRLHPSMLAGSQQSDNQLYLNTNNMATLQQQQPPQQTPQQSHMFSNDMHSTSTQSTPGLQQDAFGLSMHSRHHSLDPSSAAAMGRNNGDWSGIQFSNHRHTPSDQYSDVSSSAMPSPYLASDSFDPSHPSHSPMLPSQDAALYTSALNLDQFTLNDSTQQLSHISPGHSPRISPSISPQMPLFSASDSLGFGDVDRQFATGPGPEADQGIDSFPMMGQQSKAQDGGNFGGTMSPPEINIEPAAEMQQGDVEQTHHSDHSTDALSPPARMAGQTGRQRAISESFISPGSSRGTSPMRPRSPSLGLRPGSATSAQPIARSPSPSGGIQKPRRLSSPESRHWAIGLAERGQQGSPDPLNGGSSQNTSPYAQNPNSSTASTGTDSNRRVQKHPATFQCHLCPKRFTRAYNLRSHLRTHTDERPFVCSVCRKAFARQHDRKRHEGLHSGEKKFVCRGLLQSAISSGQSGHGQTWGCGRRFARADALGRHFRSEAGRACIKPLLEEEARERRAAMMEQANHDMFSNGGVMPAQPDIELDSSTFTGMALPAALLQQYPALADIQWNAIPGPGQEDYDGGDASGRSSFDGSGGELDYSFEDEGEGGYVSGPGAMDGGSSYNSNRLNVNWDGAQNGWSSDADGR